MSEKSVLTLLSDPARTPLAETHVQAVCAAVNGVARVIGTDWLAPGAACDIVFTRGEIEDAEQAARQALGGEAVDLIAQEAGERRKRLLVCDMDSTIITVECIDELADMAGIKPQVAAITERAMRGEIDFPQALRERVALLKGLPESALQKTYDERVTLMPGARELVATMRSHGATCVLVSGGFSFFTARVREAVGFHSDVSNRLEIAGGALTGTVAEPILGADAKLQTLLTTCQQHGVSMRDSLAVGDGANDLPMLMVAGLGVAYHAKPMVRDNARARLDHCDLSALLYAQGYRAEEITREFVA